MNLNNENEEIKEEVKEEDKEEPSDEIIKQAIFQLLDKIDASKVTKKDLKLQIEEQYGWNLENKKKLLSDSLLEYFQQKSNEEEEEEEEIEEQEEEEEKEEKEEEIVKTDYNIYDNEDADYTLQPIQQKKKKQGKSVFQTPVQLSTKLSDFLGGEILLPRSEVTKRIWSYIKENNLQNPKNKREVLCDIKLQELFNRKKIDMFRMTKVLSTHMKTVAELQSGIGEIFEDEEEEPKKRKRRATKLDNQINARENLREQESENKIKEKRQKRSAKRKKTEDDGSEDDNDNDVPKRTTGLTLPVELSDDLAAIIGYRVLARTEVNKLIWKYIKENNLQDPSNKKNIVCDEKMEKLFKVKEFSMFQLAKLLSPFMQRTELPSEYNSKTHT